VVLIASFLQSHYSTKIFVLFQQHSKLVAYLNGLRLN